MEDLLLLIAFTASFLSQPPNFSPCIVQPHIVSLDQFLSHSSQYLLENKEQSQLRTFVILNPCFGKKKKTKKHTFKIFTSLVSGPDTKLPACCLFPSKLTYTQPRASVRRQGANYCNPTWTLASPGRKLWFLSNGYLTCGICIPRYLCQLLIHILYKKEWLIR